MVSEHASPLMVLGGADAGGQNVYVAALAQELGRRGHEVVVHTRRERPDTDRRCAFTRNVTVDHVDAGPPRVIPKDAIWPHIDAFADDLRRQWRRDRPDVVHAHFWMSGVAALDAAHDLGIPVIQTFHALGVVKRRHQGEADTSPPERISSEQRIVDEADGIVATCSDEAFELRQLGVDMSRVSIVPCGVNPANFTPDGPALPRDEPYRHRIATVSRLVPRKGVDDVVRALASVEDTLLLIAGGSARDRLDDDPEVRRLREVAASCGVSERVRFLGSLERADVPPLLRSSDVLVATPWYEPFGIVPLEGMATGTPVIATAVGGMIDTVADGVTGIHVPPQDPEAIAAALRRLLGDDGLRRRLGRAGVRRVRARYTWVRVADGVLDAYDQTRERAVIEPSNPSSSHRAASSPRQPLPTPSEHVQALVDALARVGPDLDRVERWGQQLARVLGDGGRLLACGNGGSAADAQHLTAELVGRYRDDREPFSAIALTAETSSLTAIGNDYGYEEIFARQVRAHGRQGDVLLAISTSGTSANVLQAARAARRQGMRVWALTGAGPNPLTALAHEAVAVDGAATATVQEVHGTLIHALCATFDRVVLQEGGVAEADVAGVSGLARHRTESDNRRGDRRSVAGEARS